MVQKPTQACKDQFAVVLDVTSVAYVCVRIGQKTRIGLYLEKSPFTHNQPTTEMRKLVVPQRAIIEKVV